MHNFNSPSECLEQVCATCMWPKYTCRAALVVQPVHHYVAKLNKEAAN